MPFSRVFENSPGRHSSWTLLRPYLLPRDLLVREVAAISQNGSLMVVVMANGSLIVLRKRQLRQIFSKFGLTGQQFATRLNVRCRRCRRRCRRIWPWRRWCMGSRYHGVFMTQVFLVGGWQSGLKNPRFFYMFLLPTSFVYFVFSNRTFCKLWCK